VGIQLSKQKEVFPFSQDHMQSVAALINDQQHPSVNASVEESEFVPGPAESDEAKLIEKKKVISEEKMAYYKEQLLELMEKDKPYLDSEITLPKLGQMLGLNTYQTSYLINNCFEENFYTFINRYRLEACKKMLISPQYTHLSILGIAFQAGFSSKTAFNTFFKKTTGLSPKDYKEQMKKENQ
jgi:YesN/AraC family two-component response regulator